MGETVQPEVITLFCDRCKKELADHSKFDAKIEFMDRDYGGGIVYSHTFEICQSCRRKLSEWWELSDD